MKIAVILPAAGQGRRFSAHADPLAARKSKIEIDLKGRPVFLRAVELFGSRAEVSQIILAVNPDVLEEFRFKWGDQLGLRNVKLVAGGHTERWETVRNALTAVDENSTHVAIHDAARPLTNAKLIDRVFDTASRCRAVIPAVPVSATLKRVSLDSAAPRSSRDRAMDILGAPDPEATMRYVIAAVDRANVVEVQTPQVFEAALLRQAYEQITAGKVDPKAITDDAGLVESLGEKVYVVEGESTNIKITRPEDVHLARAILDTIKPADDLRATRKRLFADDES